MAGYFQSENKADCTGCGACVQRCPVRAISFKEDGEGFKYPVIDRSLCVECGECRAVCPIDKENVVFHRGADGVAVAGFAKDPEIRADSSSGGLFTGIAKAFVGEDGLVFGATSDDGLLIYHIGIQKIDDLGRIRKSKYGHSDTRNTFSEVRDALQAGRKVVYSGTPCQIAGLYSFLGGLGRSERLLTVDLVCHGYFSAKFLRNEREYLEKKRGCRAICFEYRNKDGGHWKGFSGVWRFEDGTSLATSQDKLPYHLIWMKHLISRPSCHACRFAIADRVADITLADFWHVKEDSPLYDGNRGTSLVFGNTAKGRAVLDELSATYLMESVDRSWICQHKIALHGAIKAHPLRAQALADLAGLSYRGFVNKYSGLSLRDKLHRIVRRIVGVGGKVFVKGARIGGV